MVTPFAKRLHALCREYRSTNCDLADTTQVQDLLALLIAEFIPGARIESVDDFEGDEGDFIQIHLRGDDIVIRVLM
jgi:hypothetical protein